MPYHHFEASRVIHPPFYCLADIQVDWTGDDGCTKQLYKIVCANDFSIAFDVEYPLPLICADEGVHVNSHSFEGLEIPLLVQVGIKISGIKK